MIGTARGLDLLLRYGPAAALALAAGGGIWAAYDWAYDRGFAAKAAEVQAEKEELERKLMAVSDELSETVRQLELERAARERLVEEVEDAARADPGADRQCLPGDSVQRLRRRWGAPD
ncbi:hypothetical protein [Pseudooceanicola sp.]|uniref:hypothetical protein n=1 Tax=Pseudooceanicola sp. TaxID=1914328 RepID=UPI0040589290